MELYFLEYRDKDGRPLKQIKFLSFPDDVEHFARLRYEHYRAVNPLCTSYWFSLWKE